MPTTGPELPKQLLPEDVPVDERWWEDPSLDRDQLLAGLAKYALARDSRYDRLVTDTARISQTLSRATREVSQFRREAVRRDEVILPEQIHQLRRRTLLISATFALLAIVASSLFLVGTVVPRCFFGGVAAHPAQCHWIPGYDQAIRDSNERLQQQRELIQQIPANREQLARLQRQVDELEKRKP